MYSVKSMLVEKHTETCITRTNTCRHQDPRYHTYSEQAGPEGRLCIGPCGNCGAGPLPVKAAAGGRDGGAGRAGRALSLSPIPHGPASGSLFAPRVFPDAHPRVAPVSACFVPARDPSALSRRWPRPLHVPRPRVSQPGGA